MSENRDGVISLQGRQYATYPFVLDEAHKKGLQGIFTELLQAPSADNDHIAIVRATVTMPDGKVFVGIGDAGPKSLKPNVAPSSIRMAETRAKGRALRDAVNIGETLAEEMPDHEERAQPAPTPRPAAPGRPAQAPRPANGNGTHPARQAPEQRREAIAEAAPQVHASADAQRTATAESLACVWCGKDVSDEESQKCATAGIDTIHAACFKIRKAINAGVCLKCGQALPADYTDQCRATKSVPVCTGCAEPGSQG